MKPILLVVVTRMTAPRAVDDEFIAEWRTEDDFDASHKIFEFRERAIGDCKLLLIHGDNTMNELSSLELLEESAKRAGKATFENCDIWLFVHSRSEFKIESAQAKGWSLKHA